MECAGTVVRTGPDVEDPAVGDRVLAFAPGAFASHLVAKTFAVSKLPSQLSFEDATTLPVAFLTAYYSLVHLARLEAGETVLIHGGAGAVGLAAMQIAKQRGATVIATAGSGEKRAFLRSLGADFVCNSRTLAFAEEVMSFTGGKGVDVVLNSLAGEAMIRSMDCLKPFGRFIELGKRDFYANTHLGLRPLRRNLSYFGVDIDQLIGAHKALSQQLFADVVDLFAEGELSPLPHRVFDGAHIAEAFRLMQRAGHIGKIVVTPARQARVLGGARQHLPGRRRGLARRDRRHQRLRLRGGRMAGRPGRPPCRADQPLGPSVRVRRYPGRCVARARRDRRGGGRRRDGRRRPRSLRAISSAASVRSRASSTPPWSSTTG